MKLRFLGAAGTVTGSKTLVRTATTTVLVDCGLFQGYKQLRERNWKPPEVKPKDLDAVLLTHAHVDHSGWVPALVRAGYRGPIFCTAATRDLCQVLLLDSARIQQEDAEYANRKGYSKHRPAQPLYTEADAERALRQFETVEWETDQQIGGSIAARFGPAGHILGASWIRLDDGSCSVLFSGDVGRPNDLLMRDPAPPPAADHIVLESTYGDRFHTASEPLEGIAEAIGPVLQRGGMVLIPSFAVGRAQAVLWALHELKASGAIDSVPVILDSPMAVDATALYRRHAGDLRLSAKQLKELCAGVELVRSVEESKAIHGRNGPFVLVSASGMLTGGRVVHHLGYRAGDKRNLILFVGFQAPGTRGGRLVAGERRIKLHGRNVGVRCDVGQLDLFSAHADQEELVDWVRQIPSPPRCVWLNHGEPGATDALRVRLIDDLAWEVRPAVEGAEIELQTHSKPPAEAAPGTSERIAAILQSGSYRRADRDTEFLAREDMRSVRLLLEFQKVETRLREHGVTGMVVVFGSTRTRPRDSDATQDGPDFYAIAQQLGALIGEAGQVDGERVVVATGGGPGVMEAVNRGATDVGAPSIGFNITLPREQLPNPYITPELCFQFRYFAIRKMHFMLRARALIALPGGFGTFDELFDALTLMQTKKMPRIPIVLIGRSFWERFLPLQAFAEQGLIDSSDVDFIQVVETAAEAWDTVRRFYS